MQNHTFTFEEPIFNITCKNDNFLLKWWNIHPSKNTFQHHLSPSLKFNPSGQIIFDKGVVNCLGNKILLM